MNELIPNSFLPFAFSSYLPSRVHFGKECLHNGIPALCLDDKYHVWNNGLLFSCSVMSDCLWSHGLQHARLPCPSLYPGVCSNSGPLTQWCHPTISSFMLPSPSLNLSQHQGLFKWVALHITWPNVGGVKEESSIPGLGRSPGGGHGNPLQYSVCLFVFSVYLFILTGG